MKNTCLLKTGKLALLVMLAAPAVAGAQQFDPNWILRVDLSYVSQSGSSVTVGVGDTTVETGSSSGGGGGIRGEYRFSPRLGLNLGVIGSASFDVSAGIFDGTIGNVIQINGFGAFTAGLNFHLTPESSADLYVGPLLGFVNYSVDTISAGTGGPGTGSSEDNDAIWGIILGLDVPIGERGWLLQTNLRYLDAGFGGSDDNNSVGGDFSPLIFSIGFGYRF